MKSGGAVSPSQLKLVASGSGKAASSEPLLAVTDVVVRFPVRSGLGKLRYVHAVDRVSLEVARGETLGLVGESGSGKSTLARAIVRLVRPESGTITFMGADIAQQAMRDLRPVRTQLQMIFQDPYASLNPRLTVGQSVQEALDIHGIGEPSGRESRVAELFSLVGLNAAWRSHYPHELSGGQRQRVAIARALAVEPAMIVADEPVSALDVSVQAQVLNLLAKLQREAGLTYLFIGHDLNVVQHVSDRIAVMYLGRLVEVGTTEQIARRSVHPYTRALLSAVPVPDPLVERQRQRIVLTSELPSPLNPPSGCRFRTRCPFATKLCADSEPSLVEYEPGHRAACHFAGQIDFAHLPKAEARVSQKEKV